MEADLAPRTLPEEEPSPPPSGCSKGQCSGHRYPTPVAETVVEVLGAAVAAPAAVAVGVVGAAAAVVAVGVGVAAAAVAVAAESLHFCSVIQPYFLHEHFVHFLHSGCEHFLVHSG